MVQLPIVFLSFVRFKGSVYLQCDKRITFIFNDDKSVRNCPFKCCEQTWMWSKEKNNCWIYYINLILFIFTFVYQYQIKGLKVHSCVAMSASESLFMVYCNTAVLLMYRYTNLQQLNITHSSSSLAVLQYSSL